MHAVHIRHLGRTEYTACWQAMQSYTAQRTADSLDEIWLTEHDPVFTQGQAGRSEHIFATGPIPVVHTDRGGQVTYHAPGQIVAYVLIDIQRRGYGVRELVTRIEQALIDLLATWHIVATRRPNAPGVYVGEAKIAALGLRIRHGCSYHGLALNIEMDLSPFSQINPCGYTGLQVTQLRNCAVNATIQEVIPLLSQQLMQHICASSQRIG